MQQQKRMAKYLLGIAATTYKERWINLKTGVGNTVMASTFGKICVLIP
jgi:hypothetical protein